MKWKSYFWPAVGLCAVAFSIWLLYKELRGIALEKLEDGIGAIPIHAWLLSAASSVVAYIALAGYDHVALTHLEESTLRLHHCLFLHDLRLVASRKKGRSGGS